MSGASGGGVCSSVAAASESDTGISDEATAPEASSSLNIAPTPLSTGTPGIAPSAGADGRVGSLLYKFEINSFAPRSWRLARKPRSQHGHAQTKTSTQKQTHTDTHLDRINRRSAARHRCLANSTCGRTTINRTSAFSMCCMRLDVAFSPHRPSSAWRALNGS